MADIDAGMFQVSYDEDARSYVVTEQLEGRQMIDADIEDVLKFVRDNIWIPDDNE